MEFFFRNAQYMPCILLFTENQSENEGSHTNKDES